MTQKKQKNTKEDMILPIYLYGQPVLRQEADDVDENYPDLKKLVENMYETM